MKSVISIIIGVGIFITTFILSGKFINYISHLFTHPDVILATKIILWIVLFGAIFWVSVVLGLLFGSLIYNLSFKSKNNVSNYRK